MKPFIPINAFQSFYSSFSELLTPEGINLFQKKIEQDGEEVFKKYNASIEEKQAFIDALANPKFILFHSWTEQNQVLFSLLTTGKLNLFTDKAKHLQHQYANEYKKFLSPFLSELLLKFDDSKELNIRLKALSFCQLLDKAHAPVVESQLFSPTLSEIKTIASSCKTIEDEKELIRRVTPLCKEEIIQSVNYLSRSSYGLKMEYVDTILSILKYKSCTPRFANWVLKELKKIELNKEHNTKITDFIRDLKKGELTVRNHGKQKRIIKTSTILTFLIVVLLGSSVFYLIKYKPFSEVEDEKISSETSFMQFSVEERKKIDSLLLVMNGNSKKDQIQIDKGTPLIGESDILTVRKSFVNEKFYAIHDDFLFDAEGRTYLSDSCKTVVDFIEIEGTKKLKKKNGESNAKMKNESGYDVIIIVGEFAKNGAVYSAYLKQEETISFHLNKDDLIFLVAGTELNNYKKTNNKTKPSSKRFKQHFCYIDDNYYNSIATVYQVKHNNFSRIKLLLKGNFGASFFMIDLQSALMEI